MSKKMGASCLLVFTVGVVFVLKLYIYYMFLLGVCELTEFSMKPRASKQLGSSAGSLGASGGNNVPQMARDGFPDKQGTIAATWQS